MTINTSAILTPVVTVPGQLSGIERLGLGQFTAIPETARPVAVLDETAMTQAFNPRQQLQQQISAADWGMRMRISAASVTREEQPTNVKRQGFASDDDGGGEGGDSEETALDGRLSAALSRRVQIAVHYGLTEDEVGRQLNITV